MPDALNARPRAQAEKRGTESFFSTTKYLRNQFPKFKANYVNVVNPVNTVNAVNTLRHYEHIIEQYVPNQSGDVFVLRASAKFELLATNSVSEPTNASLAASDGEFFLRTDKGLWCFGDLASAK